MKKKKKFLIFWIIFIVIFFSLWINVLINKKFIKDYTKTEIEYRGYSAKDINKIDIDHSYLRFILWYNEWRISVEFLKLPNIFFYFTYRDNKIIFQWVSSDPMMDKDLVIEYSEKFKNWLLLK